MVLSATFPKGNSLLIFFSIISPPFIDPYLKIGKLLILSTFTLSISKQCISSKFELLIISKNF